MEDAFLSSKYSDIVRRRLPVSLTVALSLIALAIVVALSLPSTFKSRAVILIEQQEIPPDLIRSLVTGYADQRIQIISQRVLTNANLRDIIQKYDLYAEERQREPLETILADMRDDIAVSSISADIVDERSGRATQATIAFELSYRNESPQLAQRVANELTTLFLNENLKQRTETAEEALAFLTTESEKLREQVSDLESALAEFKEGNVSKLPEMTSLNVQLMNSREQDLSQVDSQIRSLEQQRVYLESELAQQQPTSMLYTEAGERVLGPGDRLKILESEFIPLTARYGSSHPDVVAMRKEIESLRGQVGSSGSGSELHLRLKGLQAELGLMDEKYSDDHPDVRRVRREIESVKEQIVSADDQQRSAIPAPAVAPDNPAYIQLQARLQTTLNDIASLRRQRETLQAKIADFESRLMQAPEIEREYRMLSRDYEIALAKYQEVLAKRQEAELSKNLEATQKGERFTLIEPPVLPEEPDSPNRVALGFLGAVLAVAGGLGAGTLSEALDDRIYGRTGVLRLTGVQPLAVIPRIDTAEAMRRRTARRVLIGLVLVVAFVVGLGAIHMFFRPLDVLMYQILRVLGV